MRVIRLYQQQITANCQSFLLTSSAHHYISRVLRLKKGVQIEIFNGSGGQFISEIVDSNKQNTVVRVIKEIVNDKESPLDLTLCLAVLKTNAMDRSLEKAVELGVSKIIPFWADFTDFKLSPDKALKKQQHWQEILISAASQSERAVLPLLTEIKFSKDIWQLDFDCKWIAHPRSQTIENNAKNIKNLALAIGPEGGFSEQEIALANQNAWQNQSWGKRILRADTAVIAGLTLAQYQFGDFK